MVGHPIHELNGPKHEYRSKAVAQSLWGCLCLRVRDYRPRSSSKLVALGVALFAHHSWPRVFQHLGNARPFSFIVRQPGSISSTSVWVFFSPSTVDPIARRSLLLNSTNQCVPIVVGYTKLYSPYLWLKSHYHPIINLLYPLWLTPNSIPLI